MVNLLALFAIPALLVAAAPDPAGWQIETIDPSGVGQTSSMKIDKEGNVHVCYMLGQGEYLKYAFWDHTLKSWYTMVVDRTPNNCSLALDSKQRPHISYADYGTGEGARLRYAHWDGTEWKRQAIPVNSRIVSGYISIGLDAADNPNIAYYEYRGPRGTDYKIRLRTAMWNGKYWEVRTVDGEEGSGKVNNMTTDAQGHLHLVYANVAVGESRYAYWDGKAWTLETVEGRAQGQQEYVGLSCAVTVDKQGDPHITYQNVASLQVKYAVRKNGRWKNYVIDRIGGITEDFDRNSIVVADDGRVYISYFDAGQGVLKLAHQQGQNWVIETVDGNGSGFTSSLQIDRGTIWLTYADQSNLSLKVARRAVPAPPAPVAESAKK